MKMKYKYYFFSVISYPLKQDLEGERYFGGPRKEMVRIGLSINGVLNILLDAIMSM